MRLAGLAISITAAVSSRWCTVALTKWLWRLLLILVLLIVFAAGALWVYSRQSLPQTEGTIRVPGLNGEVRIERDVAGIPSIKAASLDEALFGLGFAHAQDRLWQLETHKRIGAGRLAEAFGPAALENDKFLRALGVRRAAVAQWAGLSAPARQSVLAYTAGINAFLSDAMKARPPEFLMLGLPAESWAPEDTMAWAIMMAWDLGGNWSTELLRMRLALKMPVERVNELIPPYAGDAPLATVDYATRYRELKVDATLGARALDAAPESGVEGVGSNNWVVDGSHSESGAPLLANDPHLRLSAPALWYFARIEVPGLKVAGATIPGLPMVVLGQNEHVAWGFTNTGPDVQDLYIERINPDDRGQYQTPDGWARFETYRELIKVRGGADVSMTLRATRHGPVISDAGITDDLTGPAGKAAHALAMRWTALDADPGTLETGLALSQARSVQEFIAASARHVAPMQNMVVADRAGHIGMVAAGRVPLRKPENDLKGQAPAPGWDARYDWAGFLVPTHTPRETDPPRGWIATANQRIHGPDYPHYITNEWAVPYRMQRIEQLLAQKPKHSLASLRELQADEVSIPTPRLLPYLKKARSNHALAAQAQQQLAAFESRMAADRAAPLIFWAWVRQLTMAVFADDIGMPLYEKTLGGRTFRNALEAVIERNDAGWCDDRATAVAETCEQQIDAALTRALDELQGLQGSDVSQWQWGRAHQARSDHRPFSTVPLLARWFELRTPTGGDTYTVNVSRVNLRAHKPTGERYLNEHGPSLRALYDLGNPTNSRFMHSTGQSGNVFSPHYDSFVEAWRKVEYVPLWGQGATQVLVLAPQQ
jgi:penicillin amidase